ncbi:MAG: hypothetical protein HKN20_07790 [Gemmatimonadetes bacterium]|nr:hypothetical protein [Gemmatimonadota bacterium]
MLAHSFGLRTEQLIRNHLWRHSLSLGDQDQDRATVLNLLVHGLSDFNEQKLKAYVLVPEAAVDRTFLHTIERAECARYPLFGSFGTQEGETWRNLPFTFEVRERTAIAALLEHWGRNAFSIVFSPLAPQQFFELVRMMPILRSFDEYLQWAPFWYPESFETVLCEANSVQVAALFRHIGYYMRECEGGRSLRIYCRDRPESRLAEE